ncbi:MAG: acyl-CoA thioester hydrolase [Hyphomonadaceae bacterium]|nr:MAG: acyl-CoA thioester hydrolase [Hyphomonadaceae bacterium]
MSKDNAYAGRFDGKNHLLPVRIYYEDTDMSGVVYHANYLRYFERGRSDFLRLAGVNHTDLQTREKPMAFAVIAMDLRFKKPARIDDALLVHTKYHEIKGAKLHIDQKIMRGEVEIATAQVTAVCIDFEGNPQRPPKEMVELLRGYFSP